MFGPAKQQQNAIIQVFAYLRRHGLALGDPIAFGGEDLRTSNPTRKEKARRVEKTWALMARLGVKYADLENAPDQPSTTSIRRRRGEGHFLQVTEITRVCDIDPCQTELNEINGLANSAPGCGPGRRRCLIVMPSLLTS